MNRVQRKRTKGFKLPENTKCVNRGTKWGNPVKLVDGLVYIDASHRRKILSPWVVVCQGTIDDVMKLYRMIVTNDVPRTGLYSKSSHDILEWANYFKKLDLSELKGKNLACFCSLSAPCHADVLINLLKEPE